MKKIKKMKNTTNLIFLILTILIVGIASINIIIRIMPKPIAKIEIISKKLYVSASIDNAIEFEDGINVSVSLIGNGTAMNYLDTITLQQQSRSNKLRLVNNQIGEIGYFSSYYFLVSPINESISYTNKINSYSIEALNATEFILKVDLTMIFN